MTDWLRARAVTTAKLTVIEALRLYVEGGGELTVEEEPRRGSYSSDVPLEQQTRTITFTVNAKRYDAPVRPF